MGQPRGGGYQKIGINTPTQNSAIEQLLQMAIPNYEQAAQGFQQFLPGGGGGQAISDAAQQRFQQQTIPSILNAFGRGSKGSSALNQALASGGANLNTDLASQLAQMQLSAASGLGGLAGQQTGAGLSPTYALAQRQMPFWQSALLGGIGLGGQLGGAYLGRPGGF